MVNLLNPVDLTTKIDNAREQVYVFGKTQLSIGDDCLDLLVKLTDGIRQRFHDYGACDVIEERRSPDRSGFDAGITMYRRQAQGKEAMPGSGRRKIELAMLPCLLLLLANPGWARTYLAFQAIAGATITGAGPSGVVAADFNGDGRPDLATANATAQSVSVLLGRGDGGFSKPRRDYAAGRDPTAVAAADLNGDGHPDLVTVNNTDESLSVLLANGDGGFHTKRDYKAGVDPMAVAVSDLNGDGHPDLISTRGSLLPYVTTGLLVFLGKGDGTFKDPDGYDTGSISSRAVLAADLNGDGHPDLAATVEDTADTVAVFLGNGDGSFKKPAHNYELGKDSIPYALVTGDWNGDRRADLAVANFGDNSVSVLLGRGNGGFMPRRDYAVGDSPISLAVGDWNGDGRADLAAGYDAGAGGNKVSVLLGNGAGGFNPRKDYLVNGAYSSVTAIDLNSDGRPDLASANGDDNSVSVLLGRGAGVFQPMPANLPGTYRVGNGPTAAVLAELNGDQYLDLAVANYYGNTVSVLLGQGDGGFKARRDYATGRSPASVAAADVNGDGRADLAVANFDGNSLSVLLGNGDGSFKAKRDYATKGDGPESVAASDLNGDGHADLVIINHYHSDNLTVLLGRGDGSFKVGQSDYTGDGGYPYSAAVSDLNGDGHPDCVVAKSADSADYPYIGRGYLSVFLGNGDGSFKTRRDYPVGKGSYSVAVSDLNGDGHPDLAAANAGSGSVSLLLGNGDGSFKPKHDYAVGANPVSVAASDLNGDGHPDLAVADHGRDSVTMLLGNGNGGFTAKKSYSAGHAPCDLALGDLDHDGKPEVVTANCGSDTVSVLVNQSTP